MLKRKSIALFIILILSVSIVSTIVINEFYLKEEKTTPPTPEPQPETFENPLEGVPYVGQETNFFCNYACITMLLQYLDIDVDLQEILYSFGLGYTAYYEGDEKGRFYNGVSITQHPENFAFVTSLYGVSTNFWFPDNNNQDERKIWDQYWIKVKENITSGSPIITSVDPFSLPSIRKQFNMPDSFWDILPSGGHGIVIIGYDETSQTVCYNDPATDYYGKTQDGYYVWMTIDELKNAVSNTAATKNLIISCKKIADPLTKEERFYKVNNINIEKLNGNPSAYFINAEDLKLGINAVKAEKNDFSGGILKRINTKNILKKTGRDYKKYLLYYRLLSLKLKIKYKDLQPLIIPDSHFKLIAIEKQYVADYLRTINFDENANKAAELLEKEAKIWLKFDNYFQKFLDQGFLIGPLRGIFIIRNIEKTLDEIIQIEEKIIDL